MSGFLQLSYIQSENISYINSKTAFYIKLVGLEK